jgi:hypothetical protein
MEMNDILNGLNSCDDDCSDSRTDSCSCGPSFGGPGFGGFPGGCGQGITGCGFGSWIWILLILFYCGCGRNRMFGRGRNCCCEREDDCGCNRGNFGGGILGNCSSFLFLLVILFLCNSNNNHNLGFCGGLNPCNTNIGCGC